MTQENERSLEKRPEINLAKLSEGGVIVGVEPRVNGSLVSMSGLVLERITRERLGSVFKLPERPVYLLDPNTRRMIMLSHRERYNPNGKLVEHQSGLFAEIVEVDDEGKPHFRLTASEVILPDESYQVTYVAPNSDQLPPSHIEVTEEEVDEKGERKKKFVPWNLYLGQMQSWMNEATIREEESLEDFMVRFFKSVEKGEKEAREKIENHFPEGDQGFSSATVPANMIITSQGKEGYLYRASLAAGLYPFIVSPQEIVKEFAINMNKKHRQGMEGVKTGNIRVHLPPALLGCFPTVVTLDAYSTEARTVIEGLGSWNIFDTFLKIQRDQPIFSSVVVQKFLEEPSKQQHGAYECPADEKNYQQLLQKLKADLVLTIFLRGGAPLTK